MIRVKKYNNLQKEELEKLKRFLEINEPNILPYHTIEFAKVIDEFFGYRNLSLVAFNDQGEVIGYLPQWEKKKIIESVPWRDKGGPIYDNEDVLITFINKTKKMVNQLNLKGFIWKDFQTRFLENYSYFVNIEIELTEYTIESYWNKLPSKTRRAIRSAEKNGLIFKIEKQNIHNAIKAFYDLFITNRKKLGVPVYPIDFFKAYFEYIPQKQIKMFTIYKDNVPVASLILLHNCYKAIYAYPASNELGKKLRANDMMVYNVIKYCIKNGIKYFDFGADSPLQTGLIRFKSKWLGKKRFIITSFYGNVREIDHNKPKYNLIRKIIKKMPTKFYITFSKIIVK